MKNSRPLVWIASVLGVLVVATLVGGGLYIYKTIQGREESPENPSALIDPYYLEGQSAAKAGEPSLPVTTKSFLTFISPQAGAEISIQNDTIMSWVLTDTALLEQYANKDTYIHLQLISADGKIVGPVGPAPSPHIADRSAMLGIPGFIKQEFYTVTAGAQYKIRATISYEPKSISCTYIGGGECDPVFSAADQALRNKAKQYQSESGWFTFDSSATKSGSMSTYTNTQYGFTVEYPAGTNISVAPSYSKNSDWWYPDFVHPTNLFSASDQNNVILIVASADASDITHCTETGKSVLISGVEFMKAVGTDGSKFPKYVLQYTAVHNNVCFGIVGMGQNASLPAGLESVVQSFRFTK